MNKYQSIALAAGISLISLGVYDFKSIKYQTDNPFVTPEIAGVLELQLNVEVFRKEFMKDHNNRPDYSHVWDFDEKSRDLLTKLNEPLETKQKTLKGLYDCYREEINRRTLTNKTWESYVSWNKETTENNKAGCTYGIISMLAGMGLLALSRKK